MSKSLVNLVTHLSFFAAPDVANPWATRDAHSQDRDDAGPPMRRRLLREALNCPDPRFILIGEAPGYRGARITGVPFTSESLIYEGLVNSALRRHQGTRLTYREPPWGEATATVVWRTLHQLKLANRVVCWNAFAWHPHLPGLPASNREPTRTEIQAGLDVLDAFLHYFKGVPVLAVGQVAANTLKRCGVGVRQVLRHPSHGGAAAFRLGLATSGL